MRGRSADARALRSGATRSVSEERPVYFWLGVALPARELAAGEPPEGGDILGELRHEAVPDRIGEYGLRRRRRLRVVDDLLDHPAHPLGQPFEIAVEGAEAGQLDQLLHELVALGLLRARLLPLALELVGGEAIVDPGKAE